MPARRIVWTPDQDAAIIRMRAASASWDTIAEAVGVARWTVIERGRALGAAAPTVEPTFETAGRSADPLPAGHPETWGAIIAGTVLAGTVYPHPVFR
jgi:hypothetical protein